MQPVLVMLLALAAVPSLRGSSDSQMRQNKEADRLGLERYRDRPALEKAVRSGRLIVITPTPAYELDSGIGSADHGHETLYAHAKPWVKTFLDRELGPVHAATGIRFRVTSLVRTETYQRALIAGGESNATHGKSRWKRSSHLTGSTIDISWLGLDRKVVAKLSKRLLDLERRNLIEATMEHHNQCFHIMVFPSYSKPARR